MGKKDIVAKKFLSDNRRFADLCNYYFFDGRQLIQPKDLEPLDTAELVSIVGHFSNFNNLGTPSHIQKMRDILKTAIIKHTHDRIYIIIGIENQSDIHYAMPVRTMLYDALNYARQTENTAKLHRKNHDLKNTSEFLSGFAKTDKLTPVITLTVYLGSETWNAPRSLYEMLNTDDKNILNFISDYKLHLIAPNEITDFEKFKTSLGLVFKAIKCSADESEMNFLLKGDSEYNKLDCETVTAINTFTNINLNYHRKEELTDMCKAWDDHKLSGIREGKTEKQIEYVIKLLCKGFSAEQTADILDEPQDTIRHIYDIAASVGPDYDIEKIYKELTHTTLTV